MNIGDVVIYTHVNDQQFPAIVTAIHTEGCVDLAVMRNDIQSVQFRSKMKRALSPNDRHCWRERTLKIPEKGKED